jgi:lipid II:glycine glycyltransferase (peptidoglycan interpeptide bridge formation enzyme)
MSDESQRWDGELAERASPAPLLQTWAWGEVQSRAGWSVERVRTDQAMASVLTRKVGPAREAYVPRGPVPATDEAIESLIEWARSHRIARILVEPESTDELGEALTARGFTQATPIQPRHTRVVPMLPSEELLKTFKHGRRYNIRTGIKRGVVVEVGKDAVELARQSAAVERRESISLPDRRYYQLLLELLPWCKTYTAFAPDDHEALATARRARVQPLRRTQRTAARAHGQRPCVVVRHLRGGRRRMPRLRPLGHPAAAGAPQPPMDRYRRVQVRVRRK